RCFCFPGQYSTADGVNQSNVGIQKTNARNLTDETRSFQESLEKRLVPGQDGRPPLLVYAIEGHVVGVFRKERGIGCSVARPPGIQQRLEELANGDFVFLHRWNRR